jgi:AraC-like DNA-binding protein
MAKRPEPGVNPAVATRLGQSRDGQPLSYNRMPAPDLLPWVAWLYVAKVEMPADYRLDCHLFCDTGFIRIQLQGEWEAQTADGLRCNGRAALYFGNHSRAMPVSVTGSFTSVGLAIRPGAGLAVIGTQAKDFVDRITDCADLGLPFDPLLDQLDAAGDAEAMLRVLESAVRGFLQQHKPPPPDPVTQQFERLALVDPAASIAGFCAACGITQRRLERLTARDFGLSPKQVMRRARALDMASHLRGVADDGEAEELMLRYYDQSHLIRDFTGFFGMSPRQFRQAPQPLMTLALESRQSRRLALLERLPPGEPKPWEQG